jgi:hypothetical protein
VEADSRELDCGFGDTAEENWDSYAKTRAWTLRGAAKEEQRVARPCAAA